MEQLFLFGKVPEKLTPEEGRSLVQTLVIELVQHSSDNQLLFADYSLQQQPCIRVVLMCWVYMHISRFLDVGVGIPLEQRFQNAWLQLIREHRMSNSVQLVSHLQYAFRNLIQPESFRKVVIEMCFIDLFCAFSQILYQEHHQHQHPHPTAKSLKIPPGYPLSKELRKELVGNMDAFVKFSSGDVIVEQLGMADGASPPWLRKINKHVLSTTVKDRAALFAIMKQLLRATSMDYAKTASLILLLRPPRCTSVEYAVSLAEQLALFVETVDDCESELFLTSRFLVQTLSSQEPEALRESFWMRAIPILSPGFSIAAGNVPAVLRVCSCYLFDAENYAPLHKQLCGDLFSSLLSLLDVVHGEDREQVVGALSYILGLPQIGDALVCCFLTGHYRRIRAILSTNGMLEGALLSASSLHIEETSSRAAVFNILKTLPESVCVSAFSHLLEQFSALSHEIHSSRESLELVPEYLQSASASLDQIMSSIEELAVIVSPYLLKFDPARLFRAFSSILQSSTLEEEMLITVCSICGTFTMSMTQCWTTDSWNAFGSIEQLLVMRLDDAGSLISNYARQLLRETLTTMRCFRESSSLPAESEIPPSNAATSNAGLESILQDLRDPAIPIRAFALDCLKTHVRQHRGSLQEEEIDHIMGIIENHLDDEDSYIFLSCIQALSMMGDFFPDLVIPRLCYKFSHHREEPVAADDELLPIKRRLKLGESLMLVAMRSGKMLPKYAHFFLSAYLRAVRDPNVDIRVSAISNIATLCKTCGAASHPFITQILYTCLDMIRVELDMEPLRRGAAYSIEVILDALVEDGVLASLVDKAVFHALFSGLSASAASDRDEVVRTFAGNAITVLIDHYDEQLLQKYVEEERCRAEARGLTVMDLEAMLPPDLLAKLTFRD
eukprot:ANDGO_08095.mRNA.1 hypothetical protein